MACESKQQRIAQFERFCRERGLAVTMQRRTVLEVVLGRKDHPTADQVFDEVRRRLRSISRTTVYRIMETLVEADTLIRICHPGSAARFDPKVHQHHHLVCVHCEGVIDLEDRRLNDVPWPDVRPYGFEIRDYHIHFRGVCAKCRQGRRRSKSKKRDEVSRGCRKAARSAEDRAGQRGRGKS